jgi:hypothetical protein
MTKMALGGNMEFWVGEVRDIQDPDGGAGKIKVIVHGQHNAGDTPIPDSDLPWAHSLMNNSPSLNGIGESVHYLPGSTVVGFWLDPATKQVPIIIGSLHRASLPDY